MKGVLNLGSWCILRMNSGDTLRLVRSLTNAGLTVWTPVERKVFRMRRDRSRIYKEAALMPSYVFGRVEHLTELLRLAMMPGGEHPRFSVYHHQGGVPLIADDQLDALRAEEDRMSRVFAKWQRRGKKGVPLAPGTEVRLTDGPFAGFPGVVEDAQGQYTMVSFMIFGKPVSIKVASILLLPEDIPAARARAA